MTDGGAYFVIHKEEKAVNILFLDGSVHLLFFPPFIIDFLSGCHEPAGRRIRNALGMGICPFAIPGDLVFSFVLSF